MLTLPDFCPWRTPCVRAMLLIFQKRADRIFTSEYAMPTTHSIRIPLKICHVPCSKKYLIWQSRNEYYHLRGDYDTLYLILSTLRVLLQSSIIHGGSRLCGRN